MTQQPRQPIGDVTSPDEKQSWLYSDAVKDHFFSPRNFARGEVDESRFNGVGAVGSPACGDELRVWLYIDPATERIKRFVWKTFGCASAIAATSVISEMVTEGQGMTVENAFRIAPQDVIARLGGLPPRKIHCSVLCDQALREAVNDYYRRTNQVEKIKARLPLPENSCYSAHDKS